MSFGFDFRTGDSGALVQSLSTAATMGAVIRQQLVPHKVSTVINFSDTNFSNYYVTYIWDGTLSAQDNFGYLQPSELWVLAAPNITLNYSNKTATIYWDVLQYEYNPYNAQITANIAVTVYGV